MAKNEIDNMTSAQLYELAEKKKKEEESSFLIELMRSESKFKKSIEDKVPANTLSSLVKTYNTVVEGVSWDQDVVLRVTVSTSFWAAVNVSLENNLYFEWEWYNLEEVVNKQLNECGKNNKKFRDLTKRIDGLKTKIKECAKKYKVKEKDLKKYLENCRKKPPPTFELNQLPPGTTL